VVLEASPYDNGILKKMLGNKAEYIHCTDSDAIFHRTRYNNIMAKKVQTPILALWDADIIVDCGQILNSITVLRDNDADIAYPYDGSCLDMSTILRSLFLQKKNIHFLHQYREWMNLMYQPNLTGGAVFANVEKYRQAGMDNEDFYGWGNEDYERHYRWENLKYRIHRTKGVVYHLSHPRDINGHYRSVQQYNRTTGHVQRTRASSDREILDDIISTNSPGV
jgi:hypothetical protein